MQFYTGNFVGDGTKGKAGAMYHKRSGYCFETQGYPDAVHYTHFPDVVYEAGEPYDHGDDLQIYGKIEDGRKSIPATKVLLE